MTIERAIDVWLNVATILVIFGAICYFSLIPYMTKDE